MVIGHRSVNIPAIVVPHIDMDLRINNLNTISNGFISKGYKLADTNLRDSEVINFHMVMGPDSLRLLQARTVLLGQHHDESVYLESEQGILLMGETDKLLRNLKYLPNLLEINYGVDVDIDDSCVTNPVITHTAIKTSRVQEVLDDRGDVDNLKLQQATDDALEQCANSFLEYDSYSGTESHETNDKILNYVLSNTERTPGGRLIMPLPWNPECKHLLGNNFNLAKQILKSNIRKLKSSDKLTQYDAVFREQQSLGIIERIDDVQAYLDANPNASFLPHTGVFFTSYWCIQGS